MAGSIGGTPNVDGSVWTGETPLNYKVQIVGNFIYEANAPVGTPEASALWQACRWDVAGPIYRLWADGNDLYDNVATDLSTLTYA
jgi:hypothetical protein